MTRRIPGPLLPAIALALLPLGGTAQTPPPASPPVTTGVPGLALTPAQQARAQARQQKFAQDVAALRADPKLTPAQKQAKYTVMFKAMDADMLAILTPAQRKIVLQQRAKQKAQITAFQKAHAADITKGQALAAKLEKSLTPQERQQLTAAGNACNAQIQQIAGNQSLSPVEKQTRIQTAQQDFIAKVKSILTPAQAADYQKMMALRQKLNQAAAAPPHP